MSQQDTSIVDLPKIIRVSGEYEARNEATLHGLMPSQWRYIGNREQLMGLEFREGDSKTYYINFDVSDIEIEMRMR